ncbi:Triphosphoribosyl-dephospho-CoA [Salmonella enterica subsp. enterica]|nr:Triphosphoribosyl-dephospho-CoA [Salmonella enterica subsp. enterica]
MKRKAGLSAGSSATRCRHYRALLAQGRDPELALLDTLLAAGCRLTAIPTSASRGGADGLRWLQQQAAFLLQQGGIRTPDDLVYLHRFDQQCIERNLSPGGSADLLIVTWFLAQISQVNH